MKADETGEVYKVVELTTVTDEEIERCLNLWTERGFSFNGIHFAMRESSRRPAMAFVVFVGPPKEAPAPATVPAPEL